MTTPERDDAIENAQSVIVEPCPNCGKPASSDGVYAMCRTPYCPNNSIVLIARWNDRPIEAALKAETARLQAALKYIREKTRDVPHDWAMACVHDVFYISQSALESVDGK
jgi:hypothetical protein